VKLLSGGDPPTAGDQGCSAHLHNGERVDAVGTAAQGFQGVVKRTTLPAAQRPTARCFIARPDRSAPRHFAARVVKGMRAAGRMGGGRVTIHNLKVLARRSGEPSPDPRRRDSRAPSGYVIVRKAVSSEAQGGTGREAQKGEEIVGKWVIWSMGKSNYQLPTFQLLILSESLCNSMSLNSENNKVGAIDLRDEVFGGRVNTDLMWESVVHANAAVRRGTQPTKNRANVSGSGKKPWKQKGTGRARVGSVRNPLCGMAARCSVRSRAAMTSSCRRSGAGALRAALAQKMKEDGLIVVDALAVGEAKTKAAVELLKRSASPQGGPRRRRRGRDAVAVGTQHSRRVARAEHPADRPRRDRRARVVATRGALEKLQEALA